DEAYSVYIARQGFADIPRLLANYDTHPPLHYALLHLWMRLFGSSEVAVRLPSVLASLGVVALTWRLARNIAGETAAAVAAAFIALSPFQIMSAQEARMYPFLTLFGLAASFALWSLADGAEGKGSRLWIFYAAAMALALYTHHFAFLLLVAHGVYVVLVDRRRPMLRTWSLAAAAVLLAYLPLAPALYTQVVTARGWPDIRPPFGAVALTDLLGMLSFGGGLFGMGTYFRRGTLLMEYRAAVLLPFLLLLAAGVAALADRRRRDFILLYWLFPVLALSALSVRWNMFYERYFSFVLPPFAVLMGAGVVSIAGVMATWWKRALAFGGLLALVGAFAIPSLIDNYRAGTPYNWRAVAQHVRDEARPTDFILYVPAFARIPFEYYYQGPQQRMSVNPAEVIGPRREVTFRTRVDPQRFAAIARTHPRMWIVATIPIGYDARKEIAKVLAPYFREKAGTSFGLVYAFLWESRVYDASGSRR
ncbi:MAG TPA: glycosyltransferase family 39 protein, partial [bacterium]|nr:glycosyltransferase family 39 protein [bacterium]